MSQNRYIGALIRPEWMRFYENFLTCFNLRLCGVGMFLSCWFNLGFWARDRVLDFQGLTR